MSLWSNQQLRDMSRADLHDLVRNLEKLAEQAEHVFVEADVGWCIRHDDVMLRHSHPAVCHAQLRYLWTSPDHRPVMFPDHDPGRCVSVALYRQAEDP